VTQRYEKLGQSESESDWSRDEKKDYSQDEGETDVEMSEVYFPVLYRASDRMHSTASHPRTTRREAWDSCLGLRSHSRPDDCAAGISQWCLSGVWFQKALP
jgi:hypothetical protein